MQSRKKPKTTLLDRERVRKNFLWGSVEYSDSWYECPRVLKLTQFRAGERKRFKAYIGAHNLQNRAWSYTLCGVTSSYAIERKSAGTCVVWSCASCCPAWHWALVAARAATAVWSSACTSRPWWQTGATFHSVRPTKCLTKPNPTRGQNKPSLV